jgi:hypothetical protein
MPAVLTEPTVSLYFVTLPIACDPVGAVYLGEHAVPVWRIALAGLAPVAPLSHAVAAESEMVTPVAAAEASAVVRLWVSGAFA